MWQWAFVSWKRADCTWSECNFLRLFMYEFLMWIFCFIPRNICQAKVLSVLCVCVRTCTNLLVLNTEVKKCYVFGCLHLGQWPMTYLITLSDWTMSCQPWLPRARYGQWARYKYTTWAYRILYKIAKSHGVYLKFRRVNATENFYIM